MSAHEQIKDPFTPYVVWSNEHNAWWKPGRLGYSRSIREAGIFPRKEALVICDEATFAQWMPQTLTGKWHTPHELPVAVADLPADARQQLEAGMKERHNAKV